MANDSSSYRGDLGLYKYEASIPAAVIFIIAFLASACFHLFQMCKKKAWFYTAMVVGSFMMAFGYVFRAISAKSPNSLIPYIMQSMLIILPPSLYAATIYMIYGRIVLFVKSPDASVIRPQLVTKIFVCGDVIAFLMQAGGGGMMAIASMADMGQKIIMIGLFAQLLFFGFFLVVSIIFWRRVHASAISPARNSWQNLFKLLLFGAVIIILRCLFRIIEFGQGHSGHLISHEVYMYVFDTVPMLIVQVAFHFFHAGDVFNGEDDGLGMKILP